MDSKRGQNGQKTRFISAGPTFPTQNISAEQMLLINTDPTDSRFRTQETDPLFPETSPDSHLSTSLFTILKPNSPVKDPFQTC